MKNEAAGSSKFASDLAPAAISNLQVVIPHIEQPSSRGQLLLCMRGTGSRGSGVRWLPVRLCWWRSRDPGGEAATRDWRRGYEKSDIKSCG